MSKRTEESAFGRGDGPSMIEGLMDAFAGGNRTAPMPISQPLTGSFNSQNPVQKPDSSTVVNGAVVEKALDTKAPQVVQQNATFTSNTDVGALRDNINQAGANVKAAKIELAKIDQPGLKQSFAPAATGANNQPPSMSRELGGALVFNAATGGLTNMALTAVGMNNPVVVGAFAAKTVVDVASIIGRGSYGDTTPSAFTTQFRRGKNSDRSPGYERSTAPVMDDLNRRLSQIPGGGPVARLLSGSDVENIGMTVRTQEIKLGEKPLKDCQECLDQLSRRVAMADTALTVRGEKGATVSVADAVQAASERDMKSGFKVASIDKPVQIFGNLA